MLRLTKAGLGQGGTGASPEERLLLWEQVAGMIKPILMDVYIVMYIYIYIYIYILIYTHSTLLCSRLVYTNII